MHEVLVAPADGAENRNPRYLARYSPPTAFHRCQSGKHEPPKKRRFGGYARHARRPAEHRCSDQEGGQSSGRDQALVPDHEFYVLLATVAGILVAVAQADNFGAPRAWTLIAAVALGYMVSRGLAKSGSAHRDRDDNDGVL
jgi:hypothetical protein